MHREEEEEGEEEGGCWVECVGSLERYFTRWVIWGDGSSTLCRAAEKIRWSQEQLSTWV